MWERLGQNPLRKKVEYFQGDAVDSETCFCFILGRKVTPCTHDVSKASLRRFGEGQRLACEVFFCFVLFRFVMFSGKPYDCTANDSPPSLRTDSRDSQLCKKRQLCRAFYGISREESLTKYNTVHLQRTQMQNCNVLLLWCHPTQWKAQQSSHSGSSDISQNI